MSSDGKKWRGNMRKSGKDGTLIPARDDMASEVGAYDVCDTLSTCLALYTLPSSTPAKKLHISTLILVAASTATTNFHLFDGTGTTTPTAIFPLGINEGVALTGLEGLIHSSYVYYECTKVGGAVRFGGKLRDETATE